ncbi:MFS transporter [Nocardia sp. NPDC059240]|uniref:MFS transporter n=1 Tax=Nocardia sp. NPDC059240 TaxID=3346786 RepID=UPI00369E2C99
MQPTGTTEGLAGPGRSVNRFAVLALASAAMFMTVVDLTIVNVSLPTMAVRLGLGEDALQWVVIGYGLPFGGLLLLAGRLGDIWGRRRVLRAGLVVFTAASLAAGFADGSVVLIVARAVQGIGAALIAPSALAVVADTFPEEKQRNNALGIYGALGGAAASVGVLGGGILTDGPGWRWIFFVNIPIGVTLVAATYLLLRDNRIAHPGGSFDPRSALSVTGALVLGLYALNSGVVHGWASATTLSTAAAAVLLLAVFAGSELRTRIPLVPRSLRENRPLIMANLSTASGFGSFYGFIFLTTLLMQQELGYSPTRTGVAWLLTSITAFAFAGLTGAVLVPKFGARPLLALASLLMIASASWLMAVPAHPDFALRLLPALLAAGVAVGLFAPSVQIATLADTAATDFGAASGLMETAREFGGATVIAATSTVLLSSHTDFLHGVHGGYLAIAIAATAGVIAASIRFRSTAGEVTTTVTVPVG